MKHRFKQVLAGAMFLTFLLSWGVLQAGIAGEENRQIRIREVEIKPGVEASKIVCPEKETRVLESGTDVPKAGTDVSQTSQKQHGAEPDYLHTYPSNPQAYQHLVATGRAVLRGEHTHPMSDAFREDAIIAYEGERWDCWIAFRGYTHSPYYGRGVEISEYLHGRGRSIANCLATLEVESNFGCGGSIDFGILYGNYPNTVKGYCDLLDAYGVGNDPNAQAWFWNSPGCPRYARGFCRVVNTIENWWP